MALFASVALRRPRSRLRPAAAQLRAGAARVDYTPAKDKLPRNYTGVLDQIYVRAIVLDNGGTRAALVTLDAGGVSTDLYHKVSARAAQELKIPRHAAVDVGHALAQRAVRSRPPRSRRRSCRHCARRWRGCSRRAWPGAPASPSST